MAVHCGLARALVRLGRVDEAMTHYCLARALSPALPETDKELAEAVAGSQDPSLNASKMAHFGADVAP